MEISGISTDCVSAFVELAKQGSLRAAAENLFISEQGVRNRLLNLEAHLGVELYRKIRGRRQSTPLTLQGKQFLPQAIDFLQRAQQLSQFFQQEKQSDVHVVASQYLIAYVLIEAVQHFHREFPNIRVRLSSRTEVDIEQSLMDNPEIAFGVSAPYEASPQLEYRHLFSMRWSVIAPRGHSILKIKNPTLKDVVTYPLIFFERGSTGRQHVAEAIRQRGLSVDVELEASNTDLIVRMVEAGLGLSIVPLHPSGAVTKHRKIATISLGEQIRPIDSGILLRRGEPRTSATNAFLQYILDQKPKNINKKSP
jgi:DNA-binding transcriptional LysR family regulator